jgi:hypothetical protein
MSNNTGLRLLKDLVGHCMAQKAPQVNEVQSTCGRDFLECCLFIQWKAGGNVILVYGMKADYVVWLRIISISQS